MSASNNSSFNTVPGSKLPTRFPSWSLGLVLFLAVLLFAIIVFGNIMTIFALWKKQQLRTATNIFIMCLAASDLVLGGATVAAISIGVPELMQYVHQRTWSIVIITVMLLATSDSISSVFLIAFDRFLYIAHPLRYHSLVTYKRAYACIITLFLSNFLVSASMIWNNNCDSSDYCSYNSVVMTTQAIAFLTFYAVQYTFMTVFYAAILKIAISQRKRIHFATNTVNAIRSSDLRMVKMMFSVMGLLTVCVMPHMMITLADVIFDISFASTIEIYTGILVSLNSGMNFFIYVTKDKAFRKAIKDILCCKGTRTQNVT